jgi:hypothetical protein
MNNRDIAQTFEQIADMLAIRGDHFHKVLAYRRAAENIRELDRDLGRLREEGDLTDIPGIGAALSDKIEEMLDTGRLDYYERLAAEVPPSLVEMLQVEGLGPKRVRQIHESLAITTMEELGTGRQKRSETGGQYSGPEPARDRPHAFGNSLANRPGDPGRASQFAGRFGIGRGRLAAPDAGDDRRCRLAGGS